MYYFLSFVNTVEALISMPMESLTADKAVGTPIQVEDKIIIPLFEANFGFGGGLGGPERVYGGGAGGGMELLPSRNQSCSLA
ncbi:MAG: spore germination protein GerW family protein [Thermotogota bacterium]|nr:spore germination protein GerW family protein [Thermotogota bacterium]